VNYAVDTVLATLVSVDAPRAIDAAFRLYQLPQGLFSIAIATVLFPTISRLAARGDVAGMRDAVSRGLRQIAFVLVPASAFLLVLAEPVVRLVFQRGEFDAQSTSLTSEALVFMAIGLTFTGAAYLVILAFFSLQRPWLPTKVALFGVGLNAALDAAFYAPLGVAGIPLATSLSSAATFLVAFALLERELGGLHRARILDGLGRGLVASLASASLGWAAWRVLDEALGRGTLAQAVAVGGALVAAAAAYLGAARLLGMREVAVLTRRGTTDS
jgi:putative peptidoglycan lipid II flippase